ncbi:YncE family protein [Sphaerisporangium album]|nr:hypothetical protein [Sphaerisporangium album]
MQRRDFLRFTGGLAGTALLTACTRSPVVPRVPKVHAASPTGAGTPRPIGHILYADVSSHLSAIDGSAGTTILSAERTVPSADWTRLYTVTPANRLVMLNATTGKELAGTAVPPGLVVRTVSGTGALVALGPPPPASPYGGPGRRSTTIVVADPSGGTPPRTLRLDGNFEPDAFSRGGDALFVLEYLPATAPDRYRVRMYDFVSGTLGPLWTRQKKLIPEGAEETMRGEGRAAVLAPDHRRLHTLYTHQPGHLHTRDLLAGRTAPGEKEPVHAFVHVLDLEQRWAYCVDLPEPFGRGPAERHTAAVSADGLFVYDGSSGTLVKVGLESLAIERKARVGRASGTAWAAASADSLYLAAGSSVRVVDGVSLKVREEWRLPGAAMGVAVSLDGGVYAGFDSGVIGFGSGGGGRETSRVPVAGMSRLRHVATRV